MLPHQAGKQHAADRQRHDPMGRLRSAWALSRPEQGGATSACLSHQRRISLPTNRTSGRNGQGATWPRGAACGRHWRHDRPPTATGPGILPNAVRWARSSRHPIPAVPPAPQRNGIPNIAASPWPFFTEGSAASIGDGGRSGRLGQTPSPRGPPGNRHRGPSGACRQRRCGRPNESSDSQPHTGPRR